MSILWALLPDQFMVLAIAGIGLAVILGVLRLRKAASLIGGIALLLLSAPFVDAVFDMVPTWIFLLVLPVVVLMIVRWLLRAVLGERAADHMIGSLAADLARAVITLPIRLVGYLCRRN